MRIKIIRDFKIKINSYKMDLAQRSIPAKKMIAHPWEPHACRKKIMRFQITKIMVNLVFNFTISHRIKKRKVSGMGDFEHSISKSYRLPMGPIPINE